MFCQVTSGESCAGAAAPINSEAMDESACRRMEFDAQLNQLKKMFATNKGGKIAFPVFQMRCGASPPLCWS